MNSITSRQNERTLADQTELRFASFPNQLCCAEKPVKGRDERPAGALDSPLRAFGGVSSFFA